MGNMPQMNLGDILANLDVQVNADGMQKMLSGQRKRHILHHKSRNYGGAGAEKDRYAGLLHVCSS